MNEVRFGDYNCRQCGSTPANCMCHHKLPVEEIIKAMEKNTMTNEMKSAEEWAKYFWSNDFLYADKYLNTDLAERIKKLVELVQANALASAKSEIEEQKAEAFDALAEFEIAVSRYMRDKTKWQAEDEYGQFEIGDTPEQAVLELKRKLEQK